MRPSIALFLCCLALAAFAPARAQDAGFARTAEAEAAANAHVGPRTTPSQAIPVPGETYPDTTVFSWMAGSSPAMTHGESAVAKKFVPTANAISAI